MTRGSLAVTGFGMVTPVGFDTVQSCCAIRAGIAQFAELPNIVDQSGHAIVGARLPGTSSTGDWWLPLWDAARAACEEALAPEWRGARASRPFHLSVLTAEPERPGSVFHTKMVAETLPPFLGLPEGSAADVYPLGNAAVVTALADAQARVRRTPTLVEVIVAIDSLSSVPALAYLERAGRLKSASRARGVIPGEAVCCIVVESEEAARVHRRPIHCRVSGIGLAIEPAPVGSPSPCLGEGLTTAIRAALAMAAWAEHDVDGVYCDLNGEEYRAHEWMLALCRTIEVREIVHPADCVGDIGSASGPLLIALGALGISRDLAPGRRLVFTSSDFGARGSVCLEAVGA